MSSKIDPNKLRRNMSQRMLRNEVINYDVAIPQDSLATDDHRDVCSHFGCGKELHGYEQLCGRCFAHMKHSVIDPTKYLNI